VDQGDDVRVVTDGSGSVLERTAWDPFGEPVGGAARSVTRLGFHGRYTDPDGMQVLPGRVYDPATGQFLSLDPAVIRTRQPYAFARGDPLTYRDVSGAEAEPISIADISALVTTQITRGASYDEATSIRAQQQFYDAFLGAAQRYILPVDPHGILPFGPLAEP
jgi:RHS repeat-associated protein